MARQESIGFKMPFFGVVIPLYNKELSVARAISSVLSQTFSDFELVIVDDGSSDKSAEVISKFDDARVRLIQQDNAGPSAARNRGVKEVSGDYVSFLDADDEWDLNFLEMMFFLIDVAPHASMYSVKFRVIDEEGHVFHKASNFPEAYSGYVDDFYKEYEAGELVNSSSACIRKESLQAIGGFPEHARIGEDIYTWLRLADMNRVAHANFDCVTIYRDAENRSGAGLRRCEEIPYHIKTVLGGGAKEFTKANRDHVIHFVAKNTVLQAAGAVLRGDRRLAFIMARMLWRCSRRNSIQVLCVIIMPCALLKMIKKLRNSSR